MEGVDDALGTFRTRLWLWSMLILLLAGAASLLISRSFTDRIERLREFSRRVAEGDFRPLPPDGKGDTLEASGWFPESDRRATGPHHSHPHRRAQSVFGDSGFDGGRRRGCQRRRTSGFFKSRVSPKFWVSMCRRFPAVRCLEIVRQRELIDAVRRVLGGEHRVEAEIVTGTLRQHFFAATVASVRAGETSGAVIVLHDITALRKLERIRRDFVANVSHEFRTPLTAIQGFSETLIAGAINDPNNRDRFLAIILDHSRRLARLTEDLLRLSEMDAERLELEIRRVSVSQLVESCYETAQRRAAEKGLDLSLELATNLPDVAGDTRRLQEVLQNLLDNAIQYTLPGGKIVLSAESKNDEVVFTVSDSGIGIPTADQPRIFERFYRVDAARSREAGGTGLGLAIAKHLIEAHGGRIWVESEIGVGSQFHVSIPMFDAERAALRGSVAIGASGARTSRPLPSV